jgi:hypothetical protein
MWHHAQTEMSWQCLHGDRALHIRTQGAFCCLQVLCLVSKGTREDAANAGALEVLLDKLEGDVVDGTLAGACLDALLALLADSESNQQKFSELGGLQKVGLSTFLPGAHKHNCCPNTSGARMYPRSSILL